MRAPTGKKLERITNNRSPWEARVGNQSDVSRLIICGEACEEERRKGEGLISCLVFHLPLVFGLLVTKKGKEEVDFLIPYISISPNRK